MHGKGWHKMQLAGLENKSASVMGHHGLSVKDEPQAGEWTDHI